MAAGFVPTFGEADYQYCVDPCTHTDCAWARAFAASPCALCGERMDTQVRYFSYQSGHAHMICVLAEEDRLDKKEASANERQ